MARSPRVLLVDDNQDFRETLAELLASHGMVVGQARNGAEALAALGRDPLPDVVLLDLIMPGLDGHAVLAACAGEQRLASVRVIVLTGDVPSGEQLGVPYLLKPFLFETLLMLLAAQPNPGSDLS
jgi:CheY-like chemotaxis protein